MLDAMSPNLISSRCKPRGSRALCLPGQLCCSERGAVEDVSLACLEPLQAVVREDFADDDGARDDHRRTLRLQAGNASPLLEWQRCQPLELLFDGGAREHVAVYAVGVVFDEPEVECRQRCDRARDANRATGLEIGKLRSGVRRAGLDVVFEALGQANATEVETRVEGDATGAAEHELGRTASDVHYQRVRLDGAAGGDAAKRQQRLVVSREQPGREAVAPLDLAQEGFAVLGVADGARRNGQRSLGAEALQLTAEVSEAVANAGDREGEKAPPLVDVLAQSRDLEPSRNLVDAAVDDVGDQQARGVRAEVYRRDACQSMKKRATRKTVWTSPTAPSSRRARVVARCRRATSRCSCVVFGSSAARRIWSAVDRSLSAADSASIRSSAGFPRRHARNPFASAQTPPATKQRTKTPRAIQTKAGTC